MSMDSRAMDSIKWLLYFIGDDPNREGLKDTPLRIINSWRELFAGYKQDPIQVIRTFEDGACDEMVVAKDIDFTSMCEHHVLPFLGTATIGYIPHGRIIGLSKLARLLDIYARRLQVQERLTCQITEALDTHLAPLGSACVIKATHLCMSCRGVRKPSAVMITSSLTGVFRDKPEVRAEFLALANG